MGLEVKRVPLDFAWPIGEVWEGYLHDDIYAKCHPCASCGGIGLNTATRLLYESWSSWRYKLTQDEVDALAADGHLNHLSRALEAWWVNGEAVHYRLAKKYERKARVAGSAAKRRAFLGRAEAHRKWSLEHPAPRVPVELVVDLLRAGKGWAIGGSPFGSSQILVCTKRRAKRLGVYGRCRACGGRGHVWESSAAKREAKRREKAWKPTEPPEGEGWQLWETVTEGSPASPVFAHKDDLARFVARSERCSLASALRFVDYGYCPSFGVEDGEYVPGVEVVAKL